MRHEASELGRALVYWLWSFLFFVIGLGSALGRNAASAPLLSVVFRLVMLSVGGAALIVWTRILWHEVRAFNHLEHARHS